MTQICYEETTLEELVHSTELIAVVHPAEPPSTTEEIPIRERPAKGAPVSQDFSEPVPPYVKVSPPGGRAGHPGPRAGLDAHPRLGPCSIPCDPRFPSTDSTARSYAGQVSPHPTEEAR